MNSQDLFIKTLFYTKKRFIAEEYFPKNITLYDIKKYYKEKIGDETTIFYKNYYLNNTTKLKDSDTISELIIPSSSSNILEISIAIELREVEELKYQFSLIKFDDEDEEIYSQIIKPKLNPFELVVFLTNNCTIQIEQYPSDILKKYKLDKFNTNYAFCNSPNYLFLSGNKYFWIINKKTYSIKQLKLKLSKNNHSMLYVHNFGVFVVGGDTNTTYYYDIKDNKFKIWGNTMNNNIIKPALIYHDDYLYCFQNLNEKNKFFEKTFLGENTQKKWEIIYPRFKGINPNEFYNNNFAVSKSTEGKILFIGGKNKNTFIFNNLNDTIMKAEGENENFLFGEKIFYKLNKVMNIAIPSDFEKSKELAIVNKYQFSLEKLKYKNTQKNINMNNELNYENNINIINDNQIGNFSLQGKFIEKNKKKKKEQLIINRICGIPVFNQINYNKFRQEFLKCTCQCNKNKGSQTNLIKNKKEKEQEKKLKRNKSQLSMQRNKGIEIKVKANKKSNENKNIINIIHRQNPITIEKTTKTNILYKKNENQINNDINNHIQKIEKEEKKEKEKEKEINNENNISEDEKVNNTDKKIIENNDEKIIDIKNEELIKTENNKEKSVNEEIKDEIKKEENISEKKTESIKRNENNNNESIKISTNKKHEEPFDIFSHIKEIRENPNYDVDESKLHKDFDKSIITNFQLKESIQRNIISTKINIYSDEKNKDEKIIEDKDDKNNDLENIEINDYTEKNKKEEEKNIKENENIEIQNEKSIKSINNYQIEEEENKSEDYAKNTLKEIQNNEQRKMNDILNDKEQVEILNNENKIIKKENDKGDLKNEQDIEEKLEKKLNKENELQLQYNIEQIQQEINEQKIHEDMEPNQLININENINIEDKKDNYQYKENLEDYMAQNIEEDNDDYIEDENIKNDEQFENNNFEDENIINQNDDDSYSSKTEKIKKENNKETIEKESSIKDIEQKDIKTNSDYNINYNQEESKEVDIENNNNLENLTEEINLNYSNKINENVKGSNEKSLSNENSSNIKNKENKEEEFQEMDSNREEEINDNEEESEFQEENEEYNYDENEEEQIENDNNEMSFEVEDNEEKKEKGRDSIIHISDDNMNKNEIFKKEKDLGKYQKFVKHVDYDEPNENNNFEDEK